MYFTDNPVADAERYMAEQEEELKKLPVCDYCNEPIQEEYYFDIEGDIICETCSDRFFRKDVADYVG